ncbi:MAG TPA: DUF1501 domain-containing protein [Bryobacteraceae bacterium]|jgi:uncharacterized protein (DUF1501 family)|nr:DUF1501 domain-containing protein [Bryobacteraceae bacterium]
MNLPEFLKIQSRRSFFRSCAGGIETLALASLLEREGLADPLTPKAPHFAPHAKNVICLFMEGAPSQMDLFDPKPALQKYSGQSLPPSMTKDLRLAFIKPTAAVLASPRKFTPHGQSGIEFSDYIPNIASCADDICLVRSMVTDAFNHHPGQLLLFTGSQQFGRPTMGAWVVYGLGSESQNLPGFVVLSSGVGTSGGASNFASGFLPSSYQGVMFRGGGEPIVYLQSPEGVTKEQQRASLDVVRDLNQERLQTTGDAEIASRIASYELAFRMQAAGPDLLDFSKESPSTLDMYGVNAEKTRAFGTNCLLARRMVERGVRFVMLMHASWDQHTYLNRDLKKNCDITDQPTAALIRDLKQRGLLDSTLVLWGGEFGRTPMVEIRNSSDPENAGRDHHPFGYSMFMAGGGMKGGTVVGKTDELGFNVIEDKVHVHDLQATILNRLGFDHTKLTYKYMGREFRLTDVEGRVVQKMLA